MKKSLFPALMAFIVLICIGLTFSCNKMTTSPPNSGDSTHIIVDTTSDTAVNLKKGLLLYLPFNGSFADSSGNNNPVSGINGAALTVDEHGYDNSAFGGGGNGAAVLVTNNGSIQFDTALSVSFHFMNKSIDTRQLLVSITSWASGHGAIMAVGTGITADSVAAYDYLSMAEGDSTIGCSNWGNDHFWSTRSTWKPIQYAWYQFTGVYHNGITSFYINGQLIATYKNPLGKLNFCPSSNVVIGGWWSTDPASINGKIDEVRLYNRVLNTNEIARLARGYHQ